MNFNYNVESKNILDKIYEQKIYDIAVAYNMSDINKDNIDKYSNIIKSTKVYLGGDMDRFIVDLIPIGKDGYFFRCSIAKHNNYSFPRLYDYLGNPLKNVTYNNFAFQLWEDHMNNMLIEDLQRKFNQSSFNLFVDENLENIIDSIINYINKSKSANHIIIPIKNKGELLPTLKDMILNNSLDFSWAQFLVDTDALRIEMAKFTVPFHMYNELDKLEDDLEYCLDNFPKYTSSQLFDLLIQEYGFKFVDEVGLVKN